VLVISALVWRGLVRGDGESKNHYKNAKIEKFENLIKIGQIRGFMVF